MTDEQRVQIINLREAGNGYKKIGQILGLFPVSTGQLLQHPHSEEPRMGICRGLCGPGHYRNEYSAP